DAKDLDSFSDFTDYTDNLLSGSDIGTEAFLNFRQDMWSFGIESGYRRNLFFSDAVKEDKTYVQVLPSLSASLMPQTILQDSYGVKSLSIGFDSDVTVFKQQDKDESVFLRNVSRINAKPYVNWQILTKGPYSLKTNYLFDFQEYHFSTKGEERFQKFAGILTTEFSFSVDKVYGLAYRSSIDPKNLTTREVEELGIS